MCNLQSETVKENFQYWVSLKDILLSAATTNVLGGTGTEAVRTWELCTRYIYQLGKTDMSFQKSTHT